MTIVYDADNNLSNGATFDTNGNAYVTQGNNTVQIANLGTGNEVETVLVDDFTAGANSMTYYKTVAEKPSCFHRRSGKNTVTGLRETIGDFYIGTDTPRVISGFVDCCECKPTDSSGGSTIEFPTYISQRTAFCEETTNDPKYLLDWSDGMQTVVDPSSNEKNWCECESNALNQASYQAEFKSSGIQEIVFDCGTWSGNYDFESPLQPPQSSDDPGSQMQQAKNSIENFLLSNGGGNVKLEYLSDSILTITISDSVCVPSTANDDSNPGASQFHTITMRINIILFALLFGNIAFAQTITIDCIKVGAYTSCIQLECGELNSCGFLTSEVDGVIGNEGIDISLVDANGEVTITDIVTGVSETVCATCYDDTLLTNLINNHIANDGDLDDENECSNNDYADCIITLDNGCGQSITIDNRQVFTYEAEDSDNLTDNRYNHSIGNGNELNGLSANDWGFVVPYDGEIFSVTMGNRTSTNTQSEFQLTLDNVLIGSQLALPANSTSIVWNVSQAVTAGQSINFYTIDGNSISDSAITIYYRACIN